MLHSFPPVINDKTAVLIIGSMPGTASLQARQYYAFAHNQFWRLMFDLLADRPAPSDYKERLRFLLAHRIGLWDALAACTRRGSSDAHISSACPNDFPTLFQKYPRVHTLLFNGQAAHLHFARAFGNGGKQCLVLPSTSPAHASLNYAQKKEQWQTALCAALTGKMH